MSPAAAVCISSSEVQVLRSKNMKQAILLALAAPLFAQDPLSLREAVQIALRENPAVAGVNAAIKASSARVEGGRSGWLPKLNYSESLVRSDNPVFVFSSLLTQHQFGDRKSTRLNSSHIPLSR